MTLINGLNDDGRFEITIESDGVNRVNNIYLNDIWQFETPFCYNNEKNTVSAYDQYVNPFIRFYLRPAVDSLATLRLYEITQSVPKYQYITSIPDSTLISYGLDGPHPYSTISDGVELIKDANYTGTIWADVLYISSYSDENLTVLKQLLQDGWELGIHYSASLASKTMADAIILMNDEYEQITEIFGQSPITWCSLANSDNKSHADYAYANLNMIWRNGYNGVHSITNVGNLCDSYWNWWDNASRAGITMPSFTHETDITPAITYSISPANFEIYVQNYRQHEMQICGFYHYWTIAQNTNHTIISDLTFEPDNVLSFSVTNIGGNSRLFVAAPFVEMVLDSNGDEVNFTTTEGGIILEVESDDYRIMTIDFYRQEQMDQAISPIFAIIPLMIIISVISMVIGLGRKLK